MSTYYCTNCGDGPNNSKLNPYCPNCYTLQSNASQSSSHDHNTIAYTPHAHPLPSTLRYMTTAMNTAREHDDLLHPSSLMTSSFDTPSSSTLPIGNIPYTAPYSQRPERPSVYRWQCCECGADNSCNTDKGCANCCNHWRSACCHVYDANN